MAAIAQRPGGTIATIPSNFPASPIQVTIVARFPLKFRTWHLTPRGWLEVAEPPPDRVLTLVGTKYEEEGWNEGMMSWECETAWQSPAADAIAALCDQFGQRPPYPDD